MSQINQRTQKLLILAGDEGPSFQARDFKKVIQVIVNTYITASKPSYEEFIQQILPGVIRRVPLKQHIYAGLTAEISRVNAPLSLNLVKVVVHNLQKDLNSLKLHQSINGILYLSELMNLQKLNSQCFYDIMDDIVVYLENCKNSNHRSFFIQVFSRTLYNFCYSLNQKVHFQFKKLLERAKKYCNKNIQFSVILQAHQKGTVNDGSIVHRIFQQNRPPSTQDQIQQNIKLKINISQQKKYTAIEYHIVSVDQSDKLYQQFQKNEGPYHLTNIQQVIQLMKQNGQHLTQKLITYVSHQKQKSSFIERFFIDLLIGKAIKSKQTIVQSSILLRLIKQNRNYAQIIHTALQRGINAQIQNYDLSCQMKFAEVVTYIVNNWPVGGNQMTDIAQWDWDKFVANNQIKSQEDVSKTIAKRNVLLSIICLKMVLLNQNFKIPNCLKKYGPPEDFKSPAKYKLIEQMERFQKFQELLKLKSDSDEVLRQIKSEGQYQIFLEALFEKTSQSHTHLEVLINRYEKVFLKYKEDYDWSLLNTIRSYWSKSLYHRLLYLETMIERGYVDFASYVKYIAKVQTGSEEESSWVKMQLNELHSKFAQRLVK